MYEMLNIFFDLGFISFSEQIGQELLDTLRWEFIKEYKKVRKQENTISTKKVIKKKKEERKHALDQEKRKKTR